MDPEDDSFSEEGTELIQRLERMRGACCASCGKPICSHQALASIALGLGTSARCLPCAARQMEQTPIALAESLFAYFHRRSCYWAAWKRASAQEAVDPDTMPACFLSEGPPAGEATS